MTVIRWKNEAHRLCQPRRCRSRIRDFRFGPINRRHSTPPSCDSSGVKAFLEEVDRELLRLINASNRAGWVQSTYITPDTEVIAAQANEALVTAATNYAKDAFTYDKVQVGPVERRQLNLLKNSLTIAAPPDPKEGRNSPAWSPRWRGRRKRQVTCPASAKATADKPTNECLDIEKITEILAENRDPKRLQKCGKAGTRSRSPCARTISASPSSRTRGPTSSASRTRARCGAAVRHARRRIRQGARSPVGSAASVAPLPTHLRARQAA